MPRPYPHFLKDTRFAFALSKTEFSFALISWWAFYVAVFSGGLLCFHYRPWGDVFGSVSKITGLIPYGGFLRALHYFSGQCYLICLLLHVLELLRDGNPPIRQTRAWPKLVLLVFISFAIMLTGFILKGDKEGIFAAGIMYHLIQNIPLVGMELSNLFLRPGEDFFLLPYVYHIVLLPFMVVLLLIRHRRRIFPRGELFWLVFAILSLFACICPMPADIPPNMQGVTPLGPWFFIGIQYLLRYIPPLWAGIIIPIFPLALLALLPYAGAAYSGWLRKVAVLLCCGHLVLLTVAWWALRRSS